MIGRFFFDVSNISRFFLFAKEKDPGLLRSFEKYKLSCGIYFSISGIIGDPETNPGGRDCFVPRNDKWKIDIYAMLTMIRMLRNDEIGLNLIHEDISLLFFSFEHRNLSKKRDRDIFLDPFLDVGELEVLDMDWYRTSHVDEMKSCFSDMNIERGITTGFSEVGEKNGIIITKTLGNLSHVKNLKVNADMLFCHFMLPSYRYCHAEFISASHH